MSASPSASSSWRVLGLRASEWPLVAAGAATVAWEAVLWSGPFADGQTAGSAWWHVPGAAVLVVALAGSRLLGPVRASVVAVLGAAVHLGFLAAHQSIGGPTTPDMLRLYPAYGAQLLETGTLPAAEYPPLALVAFAAAAAVGPVGVALPMLVLPLLVAAWWQLGRLGPWGAWCAAVAALVPTVVPFWTTHYDALPTALLVLGVVAAARERPTWAGVWLGLGAAAKWTPALAAVALVLGLWRAGKRVRAGRLAAASAGAFLVWHLPFLTDPDALLAPYTFHAGRGVTGQSLPYLVLRVLGSAGRPDRAWAEAPVPSWAPAAALVFWCALVVATLAWAWIRPEQRLWAALAAPVMFLAANRIFSPQFLLTISASLAVGLALHRERAGPRAVPFAAAVAVAATANYAVWPTASAAWEPLQTLLFAAIAFAAAVALRPSRPPGTETSAGRDAPRMRATVRGS